MKTVKSALLSEHRNIEHAFFTRRGGVSGGLYASLNCAYGSKDEPANIEENRRRAATCINTAPARLWSPKQVHSARVVVVDGERHQEPTQADSSITQTPDLAVSVLGADCAPVLFSCPDAQVIGAAHAGWKGALNGVLEATLDSLAKLGAPANRVDAAIGPCIQSSSYEVGAEFRAQFIARSKRYSTFFSFTPGDKYLFDLPRFVEARLYDAGVRAVDRLSTDTLSDEELFFSYRRATLRGEVDYGRQLSAVILK